MFKLFFEKQAIKQFAKIAYIDQKTIMQQIEKNILIDPFPKHGNPKKLKGLAVFRYRVGDYRVLYVLDNFTISITKIQHRKNVYKNL